MADPDDQWHERVREWWERQRGELSVPVTALPEVAFLLQHRLGPDAELDFVRSVVAEELAIESLEAEDVARAAELLADYRDLRLGFVDASIVAMAERLGVRAIATTDRRHFGVIRPRHVERLRMVP